MLKTELIFPPDTLSYNAWGMFQTLTMTLGLFQGSSIMPNAPLMYRHETVPASERVWSMYLKSVNYFIRTKPLSGNTFTSRHISSQVRKWQNISLCFFREKHWGIVRFYFFLKYPSNIHWQAFWKIAIYERSDFRKVGRGQVWEKNFKMY